MSTRLSSVETIMWRVGHDPMLRMGVGALVILEQPISRKAIIDRLAEVAQDAPRLKWRPDDPTRTRNRPAWIKEADIDLEAHVHTLALPAPADLRTLLDLCAVLMATPFDTAAPPWDVTVIEGLDNGKGAVFLRADHVLTDGLGGRSLADLLFDGPAGAAPPTPAVPETAAEDGDGQAPATEAERRPGTVTISLDLSRAARPLLAGLAAMLNLDPIDTVVRGLQRT